MFRIMNVGKIFDRVARNWDTRFLIGNSCGLEVSFRDFVKLDFGHSSFLKTNFKKLAHYYGFVVVKNAKFVFSESPVNIIDSHGFDDFLLQDPYHVDITRTLSNDSCTVLYKGVDDERRAPTFYVRKTDVVGAVRDLLSSDNDFIPSVKNALIQISSDDYTFTFKHQAEIVPRREIMYEYASFTDDVWSRISVARKYQHDWSSGEHSFVVHSNKNNSVLHARPARGDSSPIIQACSLQ